MEAKIRAYILLAFALLSLGAQARDTATVERALGMTFAPDPGACSLPSGHRKIRHLVLLFEGRSGYSPKANKALHLLQESGASCQAVYDESGQECGMGEWRQKIVWPDGSSMDFDQAINEFHDMTPGYGSPVALKNIVLKGMCQGAHRSFADTHVMYFPHDADPDVALDCVKQARHLSPGADLTVAGYSMGGSAALAAAHELVKDGIRVDRGLTIDPVPHSLDLAFGGYFRKALVSATNKLVGTHMQEEAPVWFQVPAGATWQNYYQESDNRYGTVAGVSAGLQGFPVKGANGNQKVFLSEHTTEAHWRIFDTVQAQRGISSVFK